MLILYKDTKTTETQTLKFNFLLDNVALKYNHNRLEGSGMILEHINLVLALASTFFMVGLIWHMQIVHFPLFLIINEKQFHHYYVAHAYSSRWVIFIPMFIELLTGIGLFIWRPEPLKTWSLGVLTGLLVFLWLYTLLVMIPMQKNLKNEYSIDMIYNVTWANWARTVAWSARGIILGWLVYKMV